MNYLLSLQKKYILIFTIIFFFFFIFFVFFKFFISNNYIVESETKKISNADITNPRFAISGINQKIFVTAKEGNFLDNNNILLQKNVLFKSNNFSLETNSVVFNKKEQSANSKSASIFKSKKTIILSEGFNIYENGDKIKFFGNTKAILK